MTSRERIIRTLNFQSVDRAPRDLGVLGRIIKERPHEYQSVVDRFPLDIGDAGGRYGKGKRTRDLEGDVGTYIDAWGCVWHVAEPGVAGEVKECPLEDWSALASYELPWDRLDEADLSNVNKTCAESDQFVVSGGETRPFERLQFLRGTENLLIDLAYGTPEVFKLLEMLHEFFCREMRMWADTDIDGMWFMDDWGSQTSLLISPDMWREIFKPLYKDYCDILRAKGKYVLFHSDGHISSIYPDLIEVGVHAINSQLFCMDIEDLGKQFAGKVTFWGEIDRQYILPFGTEQEVRAAVGRVRRAMDKGSGGVVAKCEWGNEDPVENIIAVFEEWDKPLAELQAD
jgi:uroporphyrinogen decarboxylase